MEALAGLTNALGDRYTIERELGGGGMSRVFVADERALGRKVVVKVLLPDLAAGVSVDRFRREIQLAAQLQHACIVPLLSAGVVESEARSLPYYTMPLIEGESLRSRLAREGALPVPDVVRILRDVAEALSYAHEHGIVHRDIKPDNILLTKHHALVADFGVAKALTASATEGTGLTSLGIALGTPAYMAPEQASADPTMDHRADLYALGATAYEMLTGVPVFAARTPQAMLAAHATEAPVSVSIKRPAVPPTLATLVMRCLEKHPADRPRSADVVLQSLEGLTTPSGGLAPTEARPALERTRTRTTKVAIGAVAAVAVLAIGGFLWRSRSSAATTHRIERIALLPLANATGDSSQAFVADGLTREVISNLTSAGVHVIGYASVSGYSGRNLSMEQIARELHVDAVAIGALRQASPRVQLALELTDPGTRENLWSRNYSVAGAEVSGLADRTARDLAEAVRGAPDSNKQPAPVPAAARRSTPNPEAYAEYLQGRHLEDSWTPQGYRETVDHYTRAVTLDSTFAAAWASLAVNYATYGSYYTDWVPSSEAYAKAQVAADRALALDDHIGKAHFALAMLKAFRDWDWNGADHEFRRAIELEPSSGPYDLYGWLLMAIGRREDAVAMGQKAIEIDPTSAPIHSDFGAQLREAGHLERALEEATIAVKLDSMHAESHLGVAFTAALLHRPELALKEYDRYEALFGTATPAIGAHVYAVAGRTTEARALLQRLERQATAEHPIAKEGIMAYVVLGEHERAIELLREATGRHEFWWPFYFVWDPIRTDPRFQVLVTKFGFPEGSPQ